MKANASTARPALLLSAALLCGSAFAGGSDLAAARAEGLKYRQACLAGQTHQDRATCLKEANNFLADLKRNPGKYTASVNTEANADARCQALSGSDRAACIARMDGKGTVTGSVESGGMYRELVTTIPAPAQGAENPPAAAADTPPSQ